MMYKHRMYLMAMTLAVASCASEELDKGTTHPAALPSGQVNMAANKVERTSTVQQVVFVPGTNELDTRADVSQPMPPSLLEAEAIHIYAPTSDQLRKQRILTLTRQLRGMGVTSKIIQVEPDAEAHQDAYRIEYSLARIAAPACPDWSSSPTGTFDNSPFSNLACAVTTNAGQMIAHPADLEKNTALVSPDDVRNNVLIDLYRTGKELTVINSSTYGSGGSASGGAR